MKTIKAVILTLASAISAAAQTNNFSLPTKYPHPDRVRMLLSLSNAVVTAGSTVTLSIQLENTSTNDLPVARLIKRGKGLNVPDFDVELINPAGHADRLSPESELFSIAPSLPPPIRVKPGEAGRWDVEVTIKKHTEPGDYRIVAKLLLRMYFMRGASSYEAKSFETLSNPVEIQVK